MPASVPAVGLTSLTVGRREGPRGIADGPSWPVLRRGAGGRKTCLGLVSKPRPAQRTREREIISRIAEGLTNRQIGARVHLSRRRSRTTSPASWRNSASPAGRRPPSSPPSNLSPPTD